MNIHLLEPFIPRAATLATVAPLALCHATLCALLVTWLRCVRGVATPYTRKIYHFLIISAAMLVQLRWGLPGAVTYGAVVACVVLCAVWRGAGFGFYEAMARPSDAPRRTLFILIPLLTTAAGGVLANLFFPAFAPVGYMAVAWGDAVGEPVGTRWGRHRYTVPSLGGVPATRSLEGSAAVLLASAAAAAVALLLSGEPVQVLWVALVVGCVSAAAEAVSHHGLDNLTVQLAAAACAALLLG